MAPTAAGLKILVLAQSQAACLIGPRHGNENAPKIEHYKTLAKTRRINRLHQSLHFVSKPHGIT